MKKIITFLILLFSVIGTLTAQTLEKENLYLVGQFSSWGFNPEYQFSIVDDDDLILEFPAGEELKLEGQFKIASLKWDGPYDFGGNYSVDIDTDYKLTSYGGNLNTSKVITVSKIEFNLTTQIIRLSGVSVAKVFDVTKDYGLYFNADNTDNPFTFKGNGVYEFKFTCLESGMYSFKIGDAGYSTIELGGTTSDQELYFDESYVLGETNYIMYTPYLWEGSEILFTLRITSDWVATLLITEQTITPTPDPEPTEPAFNVLGNGSSDKTGVWCGGLEWTVGEANAMNDEDKDGIYEITFNNVPAGTWAFKVNVNANGSYNMFGGSNLDTENSSTGYTIEERFGNITFTLNNPADITIKYDTSTSKIILTTPSGSFGKVEIEHFHITIGMEDTCLDEYEFTAANNYKLTFDEEIEVDPEYGYGYISYRIIGDCNYATYEKYFSTEVEESGKYIVTVQFNGDYENPDFVVTAVKQSSDEPVPTPDPVVTEMYLMGNVTLWDPQDEYKLTSTDGDYFVATYTAGNEVEISGNFKVATADWLTLDFGGNYIVEAGKEYQLVELGGNLTASGKIMASKIEFTLSTATLKITGKTLENKFDLTSDFGISLVDGGLNYYPLTFKGNGVYTGTYTHETTVNPLFKIGGIEDMLTIDYGSTNTQYLELGAPYTLTRGSFDFVSVYDEFELGAVYDVKVTFTEDWGATLLITKQTVTPTPTPDPDAPIIFVSGNGGDDVSGIWCNGYVWNSPGAETANRMTDKNNDGIYEITFNNVPAGTWIFEVVAQDGELHWYNKTYLDIEASSTIYNMLENNYIVFTLNKSADVTIKFNTATEKIILTTPSGSFDKVNIENFYVYDYYTNTCAEDMAFTEENNYTVTFAAKSYVNETHNVDVVIRGNCNYLVYEKVLTTEVPSKGNYNVTIKFNGNYENPKFTILSVEKIPSNYYVAGNGGSDVTGIWCNGNEWGTISAETDNNMTDADKDGIYEITFKQVPAGTWSFKVVEGPAMLNWYGSDHVDVENSSKGYELALNDGNISFTLDEAADVTIKFNYLTNKIILTTPSGSFGKVSIEYFTVSDFGEECLEENTFSKENDNKVRFTREVEVSDDSDVYLNYRIIGNCNYAVYEKRFSTTVTESGIYDVTIIFNGDYDNPDFVVIAEKQGGSDPVVPTPVISNLQVPSFGEVEVNNVKVVKATYTLEEATEATATLSGDAAFYIQKQSLENGKGTVEILFMPETVGTYNGTLIITSGKVVESINFSAKSKEAYVEPEVLIENLQVPQFTAIKVGEATVVTATYNLENAQEAEASLSGSDAFIITKQSVGAVQIVFIPEEAGEYQATLTITSGTAISSVDFKAIANNIVVEPRIENLIVPAFEEMFEGDFKKVIATYTLVNAKEAKASLSGSDAFFITKQSVSNGQGTVEITFMPEKAGYYSAILTITSGAVSESIEFSAIAKLPASEDPEEVKIESLIVPEFASITSGETTTVIASYILRGATEATATLSDVENFTILSQNVNNGIGMVEIQFAPKTARTFNATLTITSGNESESVDFSVTSRPAPVISSLSVSDFGTTLVGETGFAVASYTLENAENAEVELSGNDAFTIKQQVVSNGQGMVRIQFSPEKVGSYKATLTVTSGITKETIEIVAEAIEYVEPEPEVVPVISNLNVPDFGEVIVGETTQVVATYTLENATVATATLNGDDAFTILRNLKGAVLIKFAPTEVGTYNATLTITSGKVSESINFSAEAVEEGGEEPEPGPGPEPTPDPEPEPDPTPDPEPDPTPDPDPYPEYPILGYLYIVDCEGDRYDEIAEYEPISNSDIDYFLVPEKLEQKIYGYDIYKFEVRNPEGIRVWNKDDVFNSSFGGWYTFDDYEGVDISKTPCYANEVWYESIEDMATWRVVYEFDNYDEAVIEKMQADSTGVLVATFEAVEEGDWGDGFYFCLGDKDDPIMELGLTKYGNFLDENQLQIPQGFKVNIYLDDSNWETEFKYYYELQPLGDSWDKGYIDLGLPSGLCWATTNLGATEPEQEGTHYAWGEIEPKNNYSYNTYKWSNLLGDNEYIKYITDDWYGLIDFRTTLEPNDDAANVALGGKWHIPTLEDAEELLRECTVENLEYKGVEGYYIKGPNGNVIFLPAAGQKVGEDYEECTDCGIYWTSTLHENYQDMANVLYFSNVWSLEVNKNPRVEGLPIRPVIHKDYVAIDEVPAIEVYAKEGTIYSELDFEIYNLTGLNVTHLNGSLEGIYIVKTAEGNQLISVW